MPENPPPVLQADPYDDDAPAECLRGLRPIRPSIGRAGYADPLADSESRRLERAESGGRKPERADKRSPSLRVLNRLSGALGSDDSYRVRGDKAHGGRVFGRRGGLGYGHHLRPEGAGLVGYGFDLGVAFFGGYIPDIDDPDPSRMLPDGLEVNLRVLLARVPDQDEGKLLIGIQQLADHAQLVVLVLAEDGRAPVLEKQRAGRDAVHVQEILEQIVDVP